LLLALSTLPVQEAAAELRVPSCAEFVDFGQKWVGLDERVAAETLGLPLYALTDADIALLAKSLRDCASATQNADERKLLQEDLQQIPVLRAARDRVQRALADFTAAKAKSERRLQQIAAQLDSSDASPASRSAVEDAEATVSAIAFELEQKRLRAQVARPLAEDDPAYGAALAALGRKHRAYAAQAQAQLVTDAAAALARHRGEFDRLALPPEAQGATIILQGIDAGSDVRWLTLRQWAALLLSNAGNTSVTVRHGLPGGDPSLLEIEVVRPGYSTAEFGFRLAGGNLLLVRSGVDGHLDGIDTPARRDEANRVLLAVVREQY
jgi:murein DD-endopeptidase MepM/ murein hydrolase activator NlpD